MELIFGTILAAIVGAIPAAAVWAFRRYRRRVQSVPGGVSRSVRVRRAVGRQRRLIADAARTGDVILVATVGTNPTRLTWAGAADLTTFEYDDLRAYKRDVQAGRVPYRSAFCCGRARKIGTRRKA
jgi:hypothetical protein